MSSILAKLNLPEYPLKLKTENGIKKIFDPIRKKWLQLTPEEWVRQSFLMYMHEEKKYPLSLTETEKLLKLYNTTKRADIVFNDRSLRPIVIVECKAPEVKLDQSTFDQIIRYHYALKVKVLIITNGLKHYAFRFTNDKFEFLEEIPEYEML